jgi:hypothetical protein
MAGLPVRVRVRAQGWRGGPFSRCSGTARCRDSVDCPASSARLTAPSGPTGRAVDSAGHPRAIFRRRSRTATCSSPRRRRGSSSANLPHGPAGVLQGGKPRHRLNNRELVAQKDPGRRSRVGVIIPAPGVCSFPPGRAASPTSLRVCQHGVQVHRPAAQGGGERGRIRSASGFDAANERDRSARRHSFAALAVSAGIVTADQFSEALEEGQRTGQRPGEVLVRLGWAGEEEIARVLAQQWELPFATGASPSQDPAVREVLPVEEARRLEVYPLSYEERRPHCRPRRSERRASPGASRPAWRHYPPRDCAAERTPGLARERASAGI